MVPVGGGGMLSGICIAAKGLKPDIKIYAAEPLKADDCARSFVAKERIPQTCKYCIGYFPCKQYCVKRQVVELKQGPSWEILKRNVLKC